jgi:uncharacterized repeat protein (TIGR01451 family)
MSSRFRTYEPDHNRTVSRQGYGPAVLRHGTETAPVFLSFLLTALFLFIVSAAPATARAATPVGTVISNTAAAAYTDGPSSGAVTKSSNTVSVTTVPLRTPSTIEFLSFAPKSPAATMVNVATGAYRAGSDPARPFVPMSAPVPAGTTTPIDLTKPVPLVPANCYHVGEPIFVQLTDLDQNLDPTRAETVIVTIADSVTGVLDVIRLTETGPDTGKFIGYIQSKDSHAQAKPGEDSYKDTLPLSIDSTIKASYTDIVDSSDSSTDALLVDPYGIVFDSVTGKPVDGAVITLIDTDTGKPATVLGDDGLTPFPATVTTGSAFVVSGTTYAYPPGGFRYPFVNPGNYSFQVTPPPGYSAPSTKADAILQELPHGPFALVTPGSRQEKFAVNPGPALHIDIPVDPLSAFLWLQKSAGKDIVASGDFLPYQLDLQNTDSVAIAPGVVITDRLPLGLRYRKGSTKLNGAIAPDPVISADGRSLNFTIGDLAAKTTATIRYVVEVAAGARLGAATNQATARSSTGVVSNLAQATITVRSDFMKSQSIIMGEIVVGPCGAPLDKPPLDLSGIRLFLEDGSYVVTDKNGMYHFEGVKPGSRVVQLDLDSVPQNLEILSCEENSRFAGKNYSQFVDLQGGILWRADFYLGLKAKATGDVQFELNSRVKKEASVARDSTPVEYSVPLHIGSVPVRNLRLTIILADGLTYRPGSSSQGSTALAEPTVMEGVLTYTLGDLPENWQGTVRFTAMVPRAGATAQLTTRALLTFNTPEKDNVRTPVADNILARTALELQLPAAVAVITPQVVADVPPAGPAKVDKKPRQPLTASKSVAMPEFVLHPHFPTFGADLSNEDRRVIDELAQQLTGLDIAEITVSGHTDHVRIAPRSRHIYADNNALSRARAASVGRYLVDRLHLPGTKLTLFGKGASEPVADNRTSTGRALNRRVAVKIRTRSSHETPPTVTTAVDSSVPQTDPAAQPLPVTLEQAVPAPPPLVVHDLVNEKDRSGVKSVQTTGLRPGETWIDLKAQKATREAKKMPAYTAAWLSSAQPGSAFLWPQQGFNPPIPSVTIAVQHDPRHTLKLFQNGTEVDAIAFDGIVKSADNKLAVSTWNAVYLVDGDNTFQAVETAPDGGEASRIKRVIHYATSPVKAEFLPEKSQLKADGKTPPVIAVKLTDKDGHPVRQDLLGEYELEPPYSAKQLAEELVTTSVTSHSPGKVKYRVGENGIALIELQPTTKADEAVLHFTFISGKQELRARLTPDYRNWILVGIAEGTAGYNTLSGHMENLQAAGTDENFYDKERLAFYTKGTIKGEWLLTAAYDSAKQRTGVTGNALFQTIDPNSYYTLYGDATSQGYEAASQRKLYLKIERDQFSALFGDYDTGLTVTELSRYSRRMNGIKAEYRSKNYDITAFGAETDQAFIKDELRGDGTSGLYRLSRKGIVLNSEKITIETRDRFHSEVVLNAQQLGRFVDYTIDYDSGAIFFKSPVPSKDERLNPIYIVVDYEIANAGKEALTYGGRAGAAALDGRLKAGLSYVHEGQVSGESNLYGVDAAMQFSPETMARAEFATTATDLAGMKSNGNAYLAEVSHSGKEMTGKAYYREQENGFGLGQQKGSETGTRKFGVEGAYKLNQQASVGGQGYRQYNLATGAVRDFIESTGTYSAKQYSGKAGLRYANDSLAGGSNATSIQGTAGISWSTLNSKLTLRADHEQSLFNSNDNADFPTRTTVGADYQLTKETMLFAQEELTYGATATTNTTRAGVKSSPWKGGTVTSSLVNDMRENNERTFATVGLAQKWQINQLWAVDGGLDHNQTIRKKSGYQFNTNVPPASGGDDFTAVSLGANYTEKKLAWANRVEYRNSDTDDKWGVISGLVNEQGLNWGWTTRLQLLHSQAIGGSSKTNADLRLGLAYRPPVSRWIVLDRLDLLAANEKSTGLSSRSKRVINNLNANCKPDRRTQLAIQYGAKYVFEKIDDRDYSGYTDLIGIEGRYDLTKEWDFGLRSALLHTWGNGQLAYSFGPSVGFNVMENAWISLGYNLIGFHDTDFSAASYTAQGPFVQFRFKFDQNTVKEGLKMINQ